MVVFTATNTHLTGDEFSEARNALYGTTLTGGTTLIGALGSKGSIFGGAGEKDKEKEEKIFLTPLAITYNHRTCGILNTPLLLNVW